MKVFESGCTFDYPWEEVSAANWRKYCPWNDKSTHVVAVDTLSQQVDPHTGILRTERLITCRQTAPKWIRTFTGGECSSHVHEISWVDAGRKKVTMRSTNLTWAKALSVRETVVYQASPDAPDAQTVFRQDATITALCGGWERVKNSIEDFTVDRFGQNARRGREGFEAVLRMSRTVFGEERAKMMKDEEEAAVATTTTTKAALTAAHAADARRRKGPAVVVVDQKT
ncbi:MAG: hypothetical protein M1826_005699 [Phylliscum demangeonii]|nr:MAG: hypothetical protein M1826_005699 [Phylliscum demangeonii]